MNHVRYLRAEALLASNEGLPDTAAKLYEAAAEIEKITAENGNDAGMLASLCDRMNTWARELGTEESTKWKDLGQMAQLLDRVVFAAKARAENDTAKKAILTSEADSE